MRNLRTVAIALLVGSASVLAERPVLRSYIEYIEIPQAVLLEHGANYSVLRKMVSEKKARIHETVVVTAVSGQRARVTSVQEVMYPTEVAENVALPGGGAPAKRSGPRVSTPTAFETRNVGVWNGIEAWLSEDRGKVELSIFLELVDYLGVDSWHRRKDEFGAADTKMPRFEILRSEQSVTLVPGQFQVLGSLTPRNSKDGEDLRLVLCVKVDVLPGLERKEDQ